jgi:hypothetical protein
MYFLATFCPVAFFRQMITLKITPLVLFLMAQKCLWTLKLEKVGHKTYFFETVDDLGGQVNLMYFHIHFTIIILRS